MTVGRGKKHEQRLMRLDRSMGSERRVPDYGWLEQVLYATVGGVESCKSMVLWRGMGQLVGELTREDLSTEA